MPVPYTFGTATSAIPLSQLDSNFSTAITIGNTAVQLGNTVTTLNNLTLANVTISSVSGPVTAAQGGTGQTSLTANNVILGNGTGTVLFVAPGASGNVLVSNGTTWTSNAAASSGFPITIGNTSVAASSTTSSVGNLTLSNTTVTLYTESVVAIGNSSTSKTIDLTSGTVQTVTMTGNCTFTMPTATAGRSFILIVNTGAGSFTGTFTSVKWPNNAAPTLTTTASRWDILTFVADGTNWYGNFAQAYQ
jgi:hypothetical protein